MNGRWTERPRAMHPMHPIPMLLLALGFGIVPSVVHAAPGTRATPAPASAAPAASRPDAAMLEFLADWGADDQPAPDDPVLAAVPSGASSAVVTPPAAPSDQTPAARATGTRPKTGGSSHAP